MSTQHLPYGISTEPVPASPDWQGKYQSERKKARILGATTVAASLLAVGVGAWGLNAQGASTMSGPGGGGQGGTSQFGGPPGSTNGNSNGSTGQMAPPGSSSDGSTSGGTGQFTPPGSSSGSTQQGGPGGMDLSSMLLNSDGSVNTDAVEQFVAQAPDGALEQILSMAVSNGELTQDQADEITAAADGTTTGTDGGAATSTSLQDT